MFTPEYIPAKATSFDGPDHSASSHDTFEVRRPWLVLLLGVALPGLHLAQWYRRATLHMREYGRCKEDRRLAVANADTALVSFTVGLLAVVPAAVCLTRTARRVQRCEEMCFGAARPVTGLLSLLAAAEALGLLVYFLTGITIGIPLALLISGAVAAAILQRRLNAVWRAEGGLRPPFEPVPITEGSAIPLVPSGVAHLAVRCWSALPVLVQGFLEWAATWLGYGALIVGGFCFYQLGKLFAAEDRTGLTAGVVTALAVVGLGVGTSITVGWALRKLAEGWAERAFAGRRALVDRGLLIVGGIGLAAAAPWLWNTRPLFHGLLMPLYQWPLVTWIPLLVGLLFTAGCTAVSAVSRRDALAGLRSGIVWRVPVTVGVWALFMILLPSLEGRALYLATPYATGELPLTTQPRLLPKAAAQAYAADAALHDAHLAVNPASGQLVWTAEHATGVLRRSPSDGIAVQPLDRVDGSRELVAGGFHPSVSRVGPGSLQWRAYDRHWLTRVQDAVIVPLGGGRAVAVAPYLGYRGFLVRHAYWAGVYVYHQDGRLEDLTPGQAMARPELVHSGRLFPERFARSIADAYGYRAGADAVFAGRSRTQVSDPSGNAQPYLTNLGSGRVAWVTVAHPAADQRTVSAIFLTDSSTGITQVWHPPAGVQLLSNTGAVDVVRALALVWEECCDGDGNKYWLRKAVEPTPVFVRGHLFYLVSVVPNAKYLSTTQPVDQTVIVDAERGVVVGQYDHSDPAADLALRRFFIRGAR